MENKQFEVTCGPRGREEIENVELNGVGTDEPLTPTLARRAARAANCKWFNATVWSNDEHGYRLYRHSARKLWRDDRPRLIVKAQLPGNAHLDVPEDTPVTIISRHADTKRGRRAALRSIGNIYGEYRHSHGNAAACRVWCERGGQRIYRGDLEMEVALEN